MIETPPSFAGAPEVSGVGFDVLMEMLRAVRLTGSVFLNARFTAPFGVISPKRFDARSPMASMRHISVFHLISSGECSIQLATGERKDLASGDIVLVPFADDHRFWSGEGADMTHADDLVRTGPVKDVWTIDHGGGGRSSRSCVATQRPCPTTPRAGLPR